MFLSDTSIQHNSEFFFSNFLRVFFGSEELSKEVRRRSTNLNEEKGQFVTVNPPTLNKGRKKRTSLMNDASVLYVGLFSVMDIAFGFHNVILL